MNLEGIWILIGGGRSLRGTCLRAGFQDKIDQMAGRPRSACWTGGLSSYGWRAGPRAASIVAMSIFFIFIIAMNARFAAARSESAVASSSTRGVICQDISSCQIKHHLWFDCSLDVHVKFGLRQAAMKDSALILCILDCARARAAL